MRNISKETSDSEKVPTKLQHISAVIIISLCVLIAYSPPLLKGFVYTSMDTSDQNYSVMRDHVNNFWEMGSFFILFSKNE